MTEDRTKDMIAWLVVLKELGVRGSTAARWAPVFADQVTADAFSLGFEEIDDFVAQVLHETQMLERLEENLMYTTPSRIVAVWPRRFKNEDAAEAYVLQPQRLAEKVYGKRVDLGNDQPGDGWKYRGSGIPMITGRTNFELVQSIIDEPVVDFPELLRTPKVAMKAGIAWWESRIPDEIVGDVERVSAAVNGGTVGIKERIALARLANQLI